MIRTDSKRGRAALMVAHCAGMVDLVALPIWVGTLISRYGLDPQRAGGLATLFLGGAVLASVALAPLFHRLPGRLVATLGFGLAAAGFWAAGQSSHYGTMALLHGLSGLAAGAALSVTHGTIARSGNPHRMFALVGIALGVFAVLFMAAVPQVVAASGGPALFAVFGGVMGVAAIVSALAFPVPDPAPATAVAGTAAKAAGGRMPVAVWYGIAGIAAMALVQSMAFSFLERVGAHRGFATAHINGMLIAVGLVNLFPAALAALLQRRVSARTVLLAGPVLQGSLVAVTMSATGFVPYALAASLFVAVMIFTHTFAFGLLAQMDSTGRAMAATPAMLMVGAAIGPVFGGTLVKSFGYGSLSVAALAIGALALACFSRTPASPRGPAVQRAMA